MKECPSQVNPHLPLAEEKFQQKHLMKFAIPLPIASVHSAVPDFRYSVFLLTLFLLLQDAKLYATSPLT